MSEYEGPKCCWGCLPRCNSQGPRETGCEAPLGELQLVAWIVFFVFLLGDFLLPVRFLDPTLAIIIYPAISVCSVLSAGLSLYLQLLDPADPNVVARTRKRKGRKPLPPGRRHVIDGENFCWICDVTVSSTSKHCRLCDKCVDVFDHHCKWLNTCVGRRTYRTFLVYLSITLILAIIHTVFNVFLFVDFFYHRDVYENRVEGVYPGLRPVVVPAAAGTFAVLGMVVVGLLGHLFGFHMYLIYHNLTTYEYIMQERRAKEEKDAAVKAGLMEAPSRCGGCGRRSRQVRPSIPPRLDEKEKSEPELPDAAGSSSDHEGASHVALDTGGRMTSSTPLERFPPHFRGKKEDSPEFVLPPIARSDDKIEGEGGPAYHTGYSRDDDDVIELKTNAETVDSEAVRGDFLKTRSDAYPSSVG